MWVSIQYGQFSAKYSQQYPMPQKKSFVLTYLTLSPIDAYVLQSSNSYAIIDSDNDLSIVRHQDIAWTNTDL